jgi:AcrR family transcriptional regulator/DNA-binding MarR family transcriptional regulator
VLSGQGISAGRRRGAATGSVLSRRGDVLVSQTQRSRMLRSAVAVISEHGYGEMSVARVTAGAGVSRRTFYDLFEDREDCFVAAFDEAVTRARSAAIQGYESERDWETRVRAALLGLLLFLDQEPGLRSLLVVDALRAGPRVQERRARLLAELSSALHETGSRARRGGGALPALTGEGVIGAVLTVIHTRLLSKRPGKMVALLNPLMGVIVLPYLGPEAAQGELAQPAPNIPRSRSTHTPDGGSGGDPLVGLPMRITYRTLLVLSTVGDMPGASNRQIADAAGIVDQGQISKLLGRLQNRGLIENSTSAQPSGEPNEWRLTGEGQRVRQALEQTPSHRPAADHKQAAR